MTLTEDSDDFPLYHPFHIPLAFGNENRFHLFICRLQAHLIALLEETLERGASAHSSPNMRCHNNIAILACLLRISDDIVPIADVILDHRLSTYDEREHVASLELLMDRQAFVHISAVWKNIKRQTCGDCTNDGNASRLGQPDPTAFSLLPRDQSLLL